MGLFNGFPREFGCPKRWIVHSKEELISEINKHNGISPCYCTVYRFEKHEGERCIYDTAILDRVFYDCDYDINPLAFDDILKMEKYYSARNIKRCIIFSGGGFHYYIKCKKVKKRKKDTLRGYQEYIAETLNLLPDTSVFGDIARIARIVDTYNGKRKRFCIAIKKEWLKKGDKWIKNRAKRPHKWFRWYGSELEDITGHEVSVEPLMPELNGIKIKSNIEEKYHQLSSMAKKMLSDDELSWKNRGALINYLFEQGYLPEEVIDILSKKLSKRKATHAIKEEKQVWYLWKNRYKYVAPKWMYL